MVSFKQDSSAKLNEGKWNYTPRFFVESGLPIQVTRSLDVGSGHYECIEGSNSKDTDKVMAWCLNLQSGVTATLDGSSKDLGIFYTTIATLELDSVPQR